MVGRGGNDVLDVVDTVADVANCGGGRDEVLIDRGLDTLKSCERKNASY